MYSFQALYGVRFRLYPPPCCTHPVLRPHHTCATSLHTFCLYPYAFVSAIQAQCAGLHHLENFSQSFKTCTGASFSAQISFSLGHNSSFGILSTILFCVAIGTLAVFFHMPVCLPSLNCSYSKFKDRDIVLDILVLPRPKIMPNTTASVCYGE